MHGRETSVVPPLRSGIALGVTVGLFYALCALAWLAAPGAFLSFMNSMFHGMDFSGMVQPRPFAMQGFLLALIVLSVWAFLAGTFLAWLRQRLAR
jgi:hypothetical protein